MPDKCPVCGDSDVVSHCYGDDASSMCDMWLCRNCKSYGRIAHSSWWNSRTKKVENQ